MSAALGKKLAAQPQRVTDTQALKFNLQGFITVQNLLPKDTVTAVQKVCELLWLAPRTPICSLCRLER